MHTLRVRVASKRLEAQDICSFELVAADAGAALPSFTAGAHVDVHLPGGLVRQYSLWNRPDEPAVYRIAVLKEATGRGGSRAMHEAVHEDAVLTIGTPRNQFALADAGAKALLLAGGIGVTPILSMAQHLSALGRPFEMHYCTRSAARTAFRERVASLGQVHAVHVHHDDGSAGQRLDIAQLLKAQPADCHLYVCGPQGFMAAVLQAARDLGWPDARAHREFFAAVSAAQSGDAAFQVQLGRSGRVIDVAADQSVVQALAQAGVVVPTSCEQGICGTCVTGVLQGTPDHRDTFLMPEEQAANRCFTPCCSRARSPLLVLDL